MDFEEDNNPFAGSSVWDDSFREDIETLPAYEPVLDIHEQHLDGDDTLQQEQQEEALPEQIKQEASQEPVSRQLEQPNYQINIAITETTRVKERGHSAVAYVIQYGNSQVLRRYSDFDSLRKAMLRLLPAVIIPPIPEKHSVVKYFLSPVNAKNDSKVIAKRMRLLTLFLRRCTTIPEISTCIVFQKFVDPGVRWIDVLVTPPVSILPSSSLLAPPLNPTKPSPLHLLLPTPQSSSLHNFKPRAEDKETDARFRDFEHIFKVYRQLSSELERSVKKQKRHFNGLVKDLGELGAYYNAFSLEDSYNLSLGIEKTGQAIDINYINSEAFAFKILTTLEEPISDFVQSSAISLSVLKFRRLKEVQLFIIETTIKRRQSRIDELRFAQEQADRLSQVLRRNAAQSPTIADAVKRLDKSDMAPAKVASPLMRLFNTQPRADDINTMTEIERSSEIAQIEKEVVKLEDCHRVILKDIGQVNTAIDINCTEQLIQFQRQWRSIMQNYAESILIWLKDNLGAWEEAKRQIDAIPTSNVRALQ